MVDVDARTLQLRSISTAFTHSALFTADGTDYMAINCECLGPNATGRIVTITPMEVVADFPEYSLRWARPDTEASAPVEGPPLNNQSCSCDAERIRTFTPSTGEVVGEGEPHETYRTFRWRLPLDDPQAGMNQLQEDIRTAGLAMLSMEADGDALLISIECR